MDRFLEVGLVQGLMRAAVSDGPKELTSALMAQEGSGRKGALIGQNRARDLAVNIVLPFLHGLAIHGGKPGSGDTYLDLYARFPKLQENRLTQEMAEQLIEPGWTAVVTTARRQQGLLHLHSLLAGGG